MPVLGQGVIPAGGVGSIGAELNYVVRRAFVPKLVVQLYNSSPFAAAMIANSQPASGGVSSVTVPAQGAQFVNMQWVNYDGSFNQPAVQPGVTNLEFNLKGAVIPIPYLGFEGLIQDGHEIDPAARRAHERRGQRVLRWRRDRALHEHLERAADHRPAGRGGRRHERRFSYGNQSRTTNTWLKAKRYAAGSTAPTRALVMQYITGTAKNCGELPTFGLMGLGTWQTLANDYLPNESYVITPEKGFDDEPWGARSRLPRAHGGGRADLRGPVLPRGDDVPPQHRATAPSTSTRRRPSASPASSRRSRTSRSATSAPSCRCWSSCSRSPSRARWSPASRS
jgi:hypothetical protein